jgi:hypothetical protein
LFLNQEDPRAFLKFPNDIRVGLEIMPDGSFHSRFQILIVIKESKVFAALRILEPNVVLTGWG